MLDRTSGEVGGMRYGGEALVVGGDAVGEFFPVNFDVAVEMGHGAGVVPDTEFQRCLGNHGRSWGCSGKERKDDDGKDVEFHYSGVGILLGG